MDWVIHANEESTKILKPTVSIFIDVDPELAMERIQKNRFERELFEEASRLCNVREKYFEAFTKLADTEKVMIVDGNRTVEEIAEEIWNHVSAL